jgi:ferredoxin-NADP reductase
MPEVGDHATFTDNDGIARRESAEDSLTVAAADPAASHPDRPNPGRPTGVPNQPSPGQHRSIAPLAQRIWATDLYLLSEGKSMVSESAIDLQHLTVDNITNECDDVILIDFIDPNRDALPQWNPGAHVDVHIPTGIVRQYSLCGDHHDRSRYTIAVLREPSSRGGSAYLHDTLRKGDLVAVSQPRNAFALKPAEQYLFLAGGIGITPIITMMRAATEQNIPWTALYAGRSRDRMSFLDEIGTKNNVHVFPTAENNRLDLAAWLSQQSADVAVYCCGPARLLDAVIECSKYADPAPKVYFERFVGTATTLDPGDEHGFELILTRSEKAIDVRADQSILDALTAHGIKVPSSCGEGTCGTCEVSVTDGEVDHRDHVLDEDERAENTCMMICCSRAKGARLVLDL